MVHFSDLTTQEVHKISDGCGIVARGLKVPDFIFTADCRQHDFYWGRGTGYAINQSWQPYSVVRWYLQGLFFLQWANFDFFTHMFHDALAPRHEPLEKLIYGFLSIVYFCAVFAVAFTDTRDMGRWKTKEEIIN